jgi:hypothetical protein
MSEGVQSCLKDYAVEACPPPTHVHYLDVPGHLLLFPYDFACGGGAHGSRVVNFVREGRASASCRRGLRHQGGSSRKVLGSCHHGRISVVPSRCVPRCHPGVSPRRVSSRWVPSRWVQVLEAVQRRINPHFGSRFCS